MAKGNMIVIKPNADFEQVSGKVIRECSTEVVGVYCKLLTFGEQWSLNIKGLSTCLHLSQDKVRKAINTLEEMGFIVRRAIHENGRLQGWQYIIYGNAVPEDERSRAGFSVVEFQTCPKMDNTEIDEDNINTLKENKQTYKNKQTENNIKTKAFDFRNALVGIGVSEETADAWLQVRKAKKAVNTELAFNEIHNEITKSGYAPEDCIRTAAVNSWRGFKADWMRNAQEERKENVAPKRKESTFEKNLRTIDRMFGTDYHQNYYGNGNRND